MAHRLSELVGPGTRPVEPVPPEVPSFTGESYVLLDFRRLDRADLPEDNLVSMLILAYGMRKVEEAAPLVDERVAAVSGIRSRRAIHARLHPLPHEDTVRAAAIAIGTGTARQALFRAATPLPVTEELKRPSAKTRAPH